MPRWAEPLAVTLAGLALCAWSFGTWPDPLVDFGRELYAPWRLVEGEALRRDLAWIQGPLSVYANAALFTLFGVAARTLFLANLAVLALATALLFRLLERAGDRTAATVGSLVFLGVFAFGQYGGIGNYTFVAPYAHELTHGFALSLAALACLDVSERRGDRRWLAGAGALLGLVFLTKPEVFLAATGALVGALALRRPRDLAPLAGAALVPPALAFLALLVPLSPAESARAVAGGFAYVLDPALRAQSFYRAGLGLDDPAASVDAMLKGALGTAALFGAPLALGALVRRGRLPRALPALAAVGITAALVLARPDWSAGARALPLVALAAVVASANRGPTVRLAFALFALLLLAKIALHARVVHYGFVLALPATMVLVLATVAWLPATLDARGRAGLLARAGAIGVLAAFVAAHLRTSQEWFELQDATLGHGPDAFRVASRGRLAGEALAAIEARLAPDETLLVLPEGVMLNYLARRRTPTRWVNFMPPELLLFGEGTMVAALDAHPPDLVALVHKDTGEYGARFFGRDYGEALMAWVRARYHEVERFGAEPLESDAFGIALLAPNEDG